MFGKLPFDKTKSEFRSINGHRAIQVLNKVRKGSSVIFVAVGHNNAFKFIGIFKNVSVIGQY